MSYLYWTIRYVPNIARGEFTNIGLLCGKDGGDWSVAFDSRSIPRGSQNAQGLSELRPWLSWFERKIDRFAGLESAGTNVSEAWVAHMRSRQANSIQFSEPASVDVASSEEGVRLLFPHLVERDVVKRRRSRTRRQMRAEVREALQFEFELTEGRDLFVQPKAVIGKQRSTFDFLRTDGASNSILNVWAFNVSDVESLEQQVQASNYFLTRVRNDGVELDLGSGRRESLSSDVPLQVIVDPPSNEATSQWRINVFEAAKEAWEINGVTITSLDYFRSLTSDSGLILTQG